MSETKPAGSEPSQIAGRYQIVNKLGAGAFGTVYKAKDSILGRMVAIKTIRLEGLAAAGASLDELVERFKREAQVSAQLKHPNIVTIYDIGNADGMSYLAMEFIDGVGLDRVIAGAGRLTTERAASIGVQIADALDFAHKHGVVHRDIKPANIMIETGDRVKVTDFGIAKVTTSGEHLTMTGSLLGTPSYMSPEQARGGQLDGRSDLFAVGCILYEMLAGQKAFRGDSITGLIFKIITEEPPHLHSLDPDVPDEMVRIIAKALAKAPETRYQTGRELAEDLQHFTHAGSTPTIRQAEMPTAPGVAASAAAGAPGTPTIQSPPTVGGATATRVTAAPTRVAPPPRPTPPSPAPPSPAPPPRPAAPAHKSGGGAGLLIGLALVGLLFLGGVGAGGWYFFLRKPAAAQPPTTVAALTESTTATQPQVETTPPSVPASTPAVSEPAASAPTTQTAVTEPPAPRKASPPPAARNNADTQAPPPSRTATDDTDAGTPRGPSGQVGPSGRSFLDEEPADSADGGEAAPRAGVPFRGGGRSFPSVGRAPRERSPRGLALVERPAVAALRHVINAEEVYKARHGRYGTFTEMASARALYLDVPVQAKAFQRKGYRFELTLEEDGFKVIAVPTAMNARPFTGDEGGYIREGAE